MESAQLVGRVGELGVGYLHETVGGKSSPILSCLPILSYSSLDLQEQEANREQWHPSQVFRWVDDMKKVVRDRNCHFYSEV